MVSDGQAFAVTDTEVRLIATMTGTMMVVQDRKGYRDDQNHCRKTSSLCHGDRSGIWSVSEFAFLPLMIGVGPVEAAINLTRVLTVFEQQGELPDLIVSLGSAGSASLPQTDIYQVSSVAYRDMDASPLGLKKAARHFWTCRRLSTCLASCRAFRERPFQRVRISFPARPINRLKPTWWIWRHLPVCVHVRHMASP